jgi:hypothetical protein
MNCWQPLKNGRADRSKVKSTAQESVLLIVGPLVVIAGSVLVGALIRRTSRFTERSSQISSTTVLLLSPIYGHGRSHRQAQLAPLKDAICQMIHAPFQEHGTHSEQGYDDPGEQHE